MQVVQRGGDSWSVATVARDEHGVCLWPRASFLRRPFKIVAAKLCAINEGLYMSIELGLRNFVIESGCLNVVSVVNQSEVFCGDLEGLIWSIRKLSLANSCRGIDFACRKANHVAHCVTKCTIDIVLIRMRFFPLLHALF